jgi:Thioesterase domain
MPDRPELSEDKRALLERYLRGEAPKTAPTGSAVAHVLDAEGGGGTSIPTDSRSPLVAVQAGGSRRPFFYAHVHVVGGAFYCIPLARDLGADQPFYLLEPYKLDGLQFSSTLEGMAATYIKAMRTVQPEGPYLLGGFCGGGLIAYEIAQQLHMAGQEVDLLVLIEPRAGPSSFRMLRYRLTGGFIRCLGALLSFGPDRQVEWFLRLRHTYILLRHPSFRKTPDFSFFPTVEYLLKDWIGLFVWMVSRYAPRQYPGKMIYFWTRKELFHGGWRNREAREVEVHIIPGTHETCRTDCLHDLAEHLKMYLNEAQAGRGQVVSTRENAV